ncbi:flavodoxin family protein [Aestuariivivens sediminis]|uniref:flavodoxin family protein n=1 Tax=Aestuariivivens sediminis TaxID=2913557 RepID=UPI001F5ADE21|nr:NAD(P)H-dependent oxidoreductase [Aestuariivivens sediminis]
MSKTVIIQGSSRSNGDTGKIVNYMARKYGFDVIDLKSKTIGHFDYHYKNQDDDFMALITEIIDRYDTLIFATPVYWYSMSGILKVFFDRISDLLHIHRETGRKMRGKNMALMSCSNADDLKAGFNMPFYESAHYLGMNYLGDIHTFLVNNRIDSKVLRRIDAFVKSVEEQQSHSV